MNYYLTPAPSRNAGIALDYALAFIDGVNWREIAEHMLEDEDEDEDEDERAPA